VGVVVGVGIAVRVGVAVDGGSVAAGGDVSVTACVVDVGATSDAGVGALQARMLATSPIKASIIAAYRLFFTSPYSRQVVLQSY